jgi:drug/metabolite transporter (DMT)-like permease
MDIFESIGVPLTTRYSLQRTQAGARRPGPWVQRVTYSSPPGGNVSRDAALDVCSLGAATPFTFERGSRHLESAREASRIFMNATVKLPAAAPGWTGGQASWPVYGAIAAVVVLWASAFVAIRAALRGYSPAGLAALRFVVASSLMAIRGAGFGIRVPDRRDWSRVVATGIVGFAIYPVLVNLGEARVSAGMASFVVNTVPVFTAIMAAIVLREDVRRRGWLGLMVSLAGAALLAFGTTVKIAFEPAVIVLVAAAVVQALYFILQKPLVSRYGAICVTSWALWSGTVCLLPFLPEAFRSVAGASTAATLAAVYLGVLPTVVGYAAWAFVTARMPVARATTCLYFVPLAATLIGWLALGERPMPLGVLGGLIAVGGVAIANLETSSGSIAPRSTRG